jgi:hypothetical protein
MKTKLVILGLVVFVIGLLLTVGTSTAAYGANEKVKAKPATKSPPLGDDLERIDFIHYKKPKDKGAKPIGPAKPPKQPTTCYKLLGVKWPTLPVKYVINPTNPQNLDHSTVCSAIALSAETWDLSTGAGLFGEYQKNYDARWGKQDYCNVMAFGDYEQANVIAVTSIWYTRRTKQIVEFDILFNTYYVWGDAAGDPSVMDLQNIATHELGHGLGLDDVYLTDCSTVTMYGYSDYGETDKRTLESADVTAIQKLYGP